MIPKCILPWVYLEIEQNGDVHPCCQNDYILGKIKEEALTDIWNGDTMNQFRLSLLKDELPDSCLSCKESEKMGSHSVRNMYNKIFEDSFEECTKNTNEDGSLKHTKFKGYHFRISNKCNFKCRMCNKESSSGFTGDIIEYSKEFDFEKFIENNIEDLELISFSGGETLIMDEHYKLLQKLIDLKKTDIHIEYSTNMSTLKYKSHDVLEYWSKWNPKKLFVGASIDEIGDRAEYIRKGTKWSIVEKNLKLISNQPFIREIHTVVTCLNVFRLPEIVQYLTDIGYIVPEKFMEEEYKHTTLQFHFVDPSSNESTLSTSILPKGFKKRTKEKIISFIEHYNLKYSTDITPVFKPVLLFLNNETNDEIVRNFLIKNIELDKDRGENLFKTIPEFIEILNEWKSCQII
jgi:radical SAM protein with 4Fe4S-binding SPASM domain